MKNHKKKNRLKLNRTVFLLLFCLPQLYCMEGKKISYQQRARTLTTLLRTYKQKKIDLNKPYGSEPPLIQSVVDDSMLSITQKLLDAGADVNSMNSKETSALAHAINNKAYQTAHELLKRKANINKGMLDEWRRTITPLQLVCREENNTSGQLEELRLIDALIKAGADMNSPGHADVTPWFASLWDYHRMKVLLDNKANPNAVGRSYYSYYYSCSNSYATPLQFLCENPLIPQREEMIALLLQYKANPNLGMPLTRLFYFPHDFCVQPSTVQANQKIADWLINAGAFINKNISYKDKNNPVITYIRSKYPPEKRIAHALAWLFKRSATVASRQLPMDVLVMIGKTFNPRVQSAASTSRTVECLTQ